eukprot:GILJ01001964.1.p1 GENE.GILJ01001964.1~~GILJ01001964.1.p1  ORF type:complete len:357 (+),score=66.01 GILJ01001964.1:139-1071(+)
MEKGLVLRRNAFGIDSDQVWTACRQVAELCNLLGVHYLQQENFDLAFDLLKKAEILSDRHESGKAATYNNLACYYRRMGMLRAALSYLEKALRLESKAESLESPADTHLNICAILSQLGKHAAALEHAQSALILLQEELFQFALTSANGPKDEERSKKMQDRIAVLAIAYHNMGVEQEFLKRYEAALVSYRKSVEFAETHLGATHGITTNLKGSLSAAQKQMKTMLAKQNQRKQKVIDRKEQKTGKLMSSSLNFGSAAGSGFSMSKDSRIMGLMTPRAELENEQLPSLSDREVSSSAQGLATVESEPVST